MQSCWFWEWCISFKVCFILCKIQPWLKASESCSSCFPSCVGWVVRKMLYSWSCHGSNLCQAHNIEKCMLSMAGQSGSVFDSWNFKLLCQSATIQLLSPKRVNEPDNLIWNAVQYTTEDCQEQAPFQAYKKKCHPALQGYPVMSGLSGTCCPSAICLGSIASSPLYISQHGSIKR